MIMEHHYFYPKVIELRTARPWSPRAKQPLSQRELVAAFAHLLPERLEVWQGAMNFDPTEYLRVSHFPLLARAMGRHMCWALEHSAVGEKEEADAALLDVRAAASEITEYDGNCSEDLII